jgi:hypothetical protein
MTSMPRPTGGRMDEMTRSPAWPDVDEDDLLQRSTDLQTIQRELTAVLDTWNAKKTVVFNPHGWFGGAARGAEKHVGDEIAELTELDKHLGSAVAFCIAAYVKTFQAKVEITENTYAAQQQIDDLASSSDDDAADRADDIVDATYRKNVGIVADTASSLDSTSQGPGTPGAVGDSGAGAGGPSFAVSPGPGPGPGDIPLSALNPGAQRDNHLTQGVTPPDQVPGMSSVAGRDPAKPKDATHDPSPLIQPAGYHGREHGLPRAQPGGPSADAAPGTTGGGSSPALPPSDPGSPATGPTVISGPEGGGGLSPSGSPSGPGGSSSNPTTNSPSGRGQDRQMADFKQDAPGQDAPAGNADLTPAEQQQKMLSDISKGIDQGTQAGQANPMVSPANAAQLPVNPQVPVDAPAAPPATAAPGASGGGLPGGGGFSGGGGGSGLAPIGGMSGPPPTPMPLGPPATPTPAAPVGGGSGSGSAGTVSGTPGSTPTGPGVHAASTANTSAAGIAAPAPIPVSAARMERDAMAASAAAGAARRQKNGGNDALTLARRIAAALNVGVTDFGFFWVTGLCADGTIVVANSYGLGYIPDSVNLPAQVQLVTADESIPPSERAKWATYPILALQGWAQAHSQKLRAIIATEAQFANFDPGTAKVVLQPDDIPDSGKMDGRSRLEVIAPAAASRLASVSDVGLMELLPPAPADPQPPADDSAMLWFDLCKPLMSTMPDRGVAHLEAFVTYAEHAQDLALYRAHTALDGAAQRVAIADWVYWQHLGVLMSDALSAEASV